MKLSLEFAVLLATQLLTAGISIGCLVMTVKFLEERLKRLEDKQDKHNCLIERMVVVEQSCKSAHHRLDEVINNGKT